MKQKVLKKIISIYYYVGVNVVGLPQVVIHELKQSKKELSNQFKNQLQTKKTRI